MTQETGGFCVDKTMTKILKPGETKVKVEIVPGIAVHLGLGEHKFEIDKFSFDCTQIINVIEGKHIASSCTAFDNLSSSHTPLLT